MRILFVGYSGVARRRILPFLNQIQGIEAVDIFAKQEGILLDYVYSGKAASGLFGYLRTKKFEKRANILFLHTGGNIHLFK